ncbi:unnamed protein product [Protopolystoma xenopodis]|uniref:Uncharacterized protein n=1 Tax=Protopolystoma xenopodis TaxID=117903 RepID=A0A448XK89_9PLAT|nr:unnamed protein product [Protopolystoma xenopodis]
MLDNDSKTPLMKAIEGGYSEIVNLLIAYRADLTTRDKNGDAPIHQSLKKGHIKIAEMLFKCGVSINTKNKYGNTPIHIAVEQRDIHCINYLLQNNAQLDCVNNEEKTALMIACINGDAEIVDLLITHGSNLDIKDTSGKMAEDLAQAHRSHECYELIKDARKKEYSQQINASKTNYKDLISSPMPASASIQCSILYREREVGVSSQSQGEFVIQNGDIHSNIEQAGKSDCTKHPLSPFSGSKLHKDKFNRISEEVNSENVIKRQIFHIQGENTMLMESLKECYSGDSEGDNSATGDDLLDMPSSEESRLEKDELTDDPEKENIFETDGRGFLNNKDLSRPDPDRYDLTSASVNGRSGHHSTRKSSEKSLTALVNSTGGNSAVSELLMASATVISEHDLAPFRDQGVDDISLHSMAMATAIIGQGIQDDITNGIHRSSLKPSRQTGSLETDRTSRGILEESKSFTQSHLLDKKGDEAKRGSSSSQSEKEGHSEKSNMEIIVNRSENQGKPSFVGSGCRLIHHIYFSIV